MRQPSNNPSVTIAYLIKPPKKKQKTKNFKKQKTKNLSVIIKKLKKAKNKKGSKFSSSINSYFICL